MRIVTIRPFLVLAAMESAASTLPLIVCAPVPAQSIERVGGYEAALTKRN